MTLIDRLGAVVGLSKYQREAIEQLPQLGPELGSDLVDRLRSLFGGQLYPPITTQSEWFLDDITTALEELDNGDFTRAAQMVRAIHLDPVVKGLQISKAGGIVRLPKRWFGNSEVVSALTGTEGTRPVFDELAPTTELKMLASDADALGVAVGVLDPVPGRDYPVLSRLEPDYLWYHWSTGRWYYRSMMGMLPIIPGDGRWVLHIAGPRIAPWRSGNWHALARAFVRKEHALSCKDNWIAKLANAARIAVSPQGASEDQRRIHFSNVVRWGLDTVFGLTPGWDVKLLESNGRGWEGFDTSVEQRNQDYMIAICGQVVSVTGGTGFSSEDLYQNVRYDMIEDTAVALAATLSSQVIPVFALSRFGPEALDDCARYSYEIAKPSDRAAEASVYTALGAGITELNAALAPYKKRVQVGPTLHRFLVSEEELPEDAVPPPAVDSPVPGGGPPSSVPTAPVPGSKDVQRACAA